MSQDPHNKELVMGEAFHHGGWGMYPTLIAGVVLVAAAIRYARTPDRGRGELVKHLSRLTFLVGALGTVTGTIKSFMSMEDTTPINYALVGFGESLHCVAFGMCMMIIAGIISAVGKAKLKTAGADLADPHTL
jgi:hypothetical protein